MDAPGLGIRVATQMRALELLSEDEKEQAIERNRQYLRQQCQLGKDPPPLHGGTPLVSHENPSR